MIVAIYLPIKPHSLLEEKMTNQPNKKDHLWWYISLPILLVFVGYRVLTGSSATRDVVSSMSRSASGSDSIQKASVKKKSEKQMWVEYYETGECQANMKRKFDGDPGMQRMVREYGTDVEKAFTPTIDTYCQCVSTGMAEGSKGVDVAKVCLPGIKQNLKLHLYGMGYDVYN